MSSSVVNSPATSGFSVNDAHSQNVDPANNTAPTSKTSLEKAIAQVKDLGSQLSNAVSGKEHKSIMSRVSSGLLAVAALGPVIAKVTVLAAGKGIDKLVDKHPVLAMAAGIAGLIGGIVLATHEPFTGIALTTAAAYTIVKSYKPVHEKLMKALGKPEDVQPDKLLKVTDAATETRDGAVSSGPDSVVDPSTNPPTKQNEIEDGKGEDKKNT